MGLRESGAAQSRGLKTPLTIYHMSTAVQKSASRAARFEARRDVWGARERSALVRRIERAAAAGSIPLDYEPRFVATILKNV
jgi:hypothetical protein